MTTIMLSKPDEKLFNKRAKYVDGVASATLKLSGVKKMFILALVPEVQESYMNLKTIFQHLNLLYIKFSLSADLKLNLNVFGKQGGQRPHSSPFCFGCSPWPL